MLEFACIKGNADIVNCILQYGYYQVSNTIYTLFNSIDIELINTLSLSV